MTQMCSRLNRCTYIKDPVVKIYFKIHENETQEYFNF